MPRQRPPVERHTFNEGFITGARLRVKRAHKHLNELERKAGAFLKRHPEDFTRRLNPQNLDYFIYDVAPNKPPPVTLGPVFGDVVHNLRSALDHIAWNLALKNLVGSGLEPYRDTAFPLIENFTIGSIDYFYRLVEDVLPDAISDIADFQPANRSDPSAHPLAVLNRLWNADKHRYNIKIPSRQYIPEIGTPGGRFEYLKDRTRRIYIPRSHHKEFEDKLRSEILFEIPDTGERVGLVALRLIHDFVRDEVVPRFAIYLPESTGLVERRQGIARL